MNETLSLPSRPGGRLLKADEAAAWQEGFSLLAAARAEAARLGADTARQVALAREEGWRAGEAQGREQAARQLARTAADVDRYLAGLETVLAELALGIARQVLGALDPDDNLARRVRQALSELREDHALTLWVPPTRVASVRDRLGDMAARLNVAGDTTLDADAARLVSPAGQIDLTLDTQLAWLRQALLPAEEPQA